MHIIQMINNWNIKKRKKLKSVSDMRDIGAR